MCNDSHLWRAAAAQAPPFFHLFVGGVKQCIAFPFFAPINFRLVFWFFGPSQKVVLFFSNSLLFLYFWADWAWEQFWGWSVMAEKRCFCKHRCVMIRVCGVKCCIRQLVVLLVGLLVVLSSGLIRFCMLIGIPLARKNK